MYLGDREVGFSRGKTVIEAFLGYENWIIIIVMRFSYIVNVQKIISKEK